MSLEVKNRKIKNYKKISRIFFIVAYLGIFDMVMSVAIPTFFESVGFYPVVGFLDILFIWILGDTVGSIIGYFLYLIPSLSIFWFAPALYFQLKYKKIEKEI